MTQPYRPRSSLSASGWAQAASDADRQPAKKNGTREMITITYLLDMSLSPLSNDVINLHQS